MGYEKIVSTYENTHVRKLPPLWEATNIKRCEDQRGRTPTEMSLGSLDRRSVGGKGIPAKK